MSDFVGRGSPLVYFLYLEEVKSIKIGTTMSYSSRLATLRHEYGKVGKLIYVGGIEGGIELERSTQKRFAHLRNYDMPGIEWFYDAVELRDYIASCALLPEPEHITTHTKITISMWAAARLNDFAGHLGLSREAALLRLLDYAYQIENTL